MAIDRCDLSAGSRGKDRRHEAGGDGYLAKPMDLDEMIRAVQAFSNGPRNSFPGRRGDRSSDSPRSQILIIHF
ncbi:MAG: hypothetical protein E2O98_03785 [Acidobacteria bacterium]|nr:MAG: hypothetical protein E2O98_03785 [Acidobacteriota bacterium]